MKTALVIRHSEGTPAGSTLDWLEKNQYQSKIICLHKGEVLPEGEDFDLYVFCGGEPNVDETEKHPWLIQEKKILRRLLAEKKRVLGLCLGAQLIAESLGARVSKHPYFEIGWHDVETASGPVKVFQYHGYSFDTPKGARRIATNEACLHQAFEFEKHVLAFQFHPETTKDWVIEITSENDHPLGKYCQNNQEMIEGQKYQAALQAWYFKTLDEWINK